MDLDLNDIDLLDVLLVHGVHPDILLENLLDVLQTPLPQLQDQILAVKSYLAREMEEFLHLRLHQVG